MMSILDEPWPPDQELLMPVVLILSVIVGDWHEVHYDDMIAWQSQLPL